MLYIVAGNNNEYRNWVAQQTIHASDTRYVSKPEQLHGLSTIEGRFIGTCYDRPDITDIANQINMIRTREKKPMIYHRDIAHLSKNSVDNYTQFHTRPLNQTHTTVPGSLTSLFPVTATTAIFDDYRSSYKVPIPVDEVSDFVLTIAKQYASYITNTGSATKQSYEYYFSDKGDAMSFANVFKSVAYEYK